MHDVDISVKKSLRLANPDGWRVLPFIFVAVLCGVLFLLVNCNCPAYADEVDDSEFPTRTCPSCKGISGFSVKCSRCDGGGYSSYLDGKPYEKCSDCNGTGSTYVSCDLCHEAKTVTGYIVTYAYAGFRSKEEVVCERTIELPTRPDVLYDQKYTKFLHWATQRNGCKIYMPGDVLPINSDLTFYEIRATACDTCKGKGVSTTTLDCAACGGSGKTYGTTTCINGADGLKPKTSSVMCPNCSGIGYVTAGGAAGSVVVCAACRGERFVTVTTRVYCDRCFGTGKETTSGKCPYCNNGSYDYSRSCKSCNGEGIKEQPVIRHNVVVDTPAKDATCTEDGCTQGTHCSECEKVISSSDAIPSLGHQLEMTDEVQPTCLNDGVSAGRTCVRCSYSEGFEPIEALGHDLIDTEEIEATCLKGGIANGRMCTRCDYAEGSEQTAPLGHDLQYIPAYDPTCTASGATEGYRCSRCSYEEGVHALDPTGHSMTITESSVPPTCENEGRTAEKTCEICMYKEMPASIPPTGHAYEYLAETPATCVLQGISEGSICTECGHIEGRETIAALGHALENVKAVAPTCVSEGKTSGEECSRCSYQEGVERIAPLGHDLVHSEFVQPTCVRDGAQAGDRCKRCDYKVGTEPIKALGHNLIQISYSSPTCTASGIEAGEVCSQCDYSNGAAVIPAMGHSWNDPVWTWNDVRDEASAFFECQHDPGHNVTINAEITENAGDQGTERVATVIHEGETYTNTMFVTGEGVFSIVGDASCDGFKASYLPSDGSKTAELHVKQVTDGPVYEALVGEIAKDPSRTVGKAYEVDLLLDGEEVHQDFGSLKLSFPVSVIGDQVNANLYHCHANDPSNITVEKGLSVENGTVTVDGVIDLSTFAIDIPKEAAGPGPIGAGDAIDPTVSPEGEPSPAAPVKNDVSVGGDLAQTGDDMGIILAAVICVVVFGLGSVFILSALRRRWGMR